MRVKLAGEAIGLESIGMIKQQILLIFPPLPKGVKDRGLPEIDPLARAGRNAYWIDIKNLDGETWQEALIRILQKLARIKQN